MTDMDMDINLKIVEYIGLDVDNMEGLLYRGKTSVEE